MTMVANTTTRTPMQQVHFHSGRAAATLEMAMLTLAEGNVSKARYLAKDACEDLQHAYELEQGGA